MKADVRYLVFAALFIFMPVENYCQKILDYEFRPPNIRFDNFQIKGGEANQKSISILIDSRGFLWSGTETGLYRFDGIRYVEYGESRGNNEGFTGFRVLNIFEDSEGTIWVGTSEALNKLDQKTGTFTSYIPDSTRKDGISNYIRSIREDRGGLLWILTRKDIFSFSRKDEKFTRFAVDSLSWCPQNINLQHEDQCFTEDGFGNKWFVTYRGLYVFNNKDKTFRMVLPDQNNAELKEINKVNCITVDRDQIVWIGTEGGGLLRWNDILNKPELIRNKPEDGNKESFNTVMTILTDRNGFVWSFGNGSFSKYNPADNSIKNYRILYTHRSIYEAPGSPVRINQAFQYDDGTIWFLNYTAGLMFRFDPVTEILSLYRTPAFMVFQCIMDETGSFWFACIRNNLFRLITSQIPYLTISVTNTAYTDLLHRTNILEDNQDRMWFLFINGTYVSKNFDVGSSIVFDQFRFPDGDTATNRGFRDSKGNLWFVVQRGKIIKYHPGLNSLWKLNLPYPPDIESYHIPVIREDKAGNIWIAEPRYGLYRSEDGTKNPVLVLDFNDRPPEQGVYTILDFLIDSQGDFWILTDRALLLIRMPGMKIIDYTGYGNEVFSSFRNNIRVAEDNRGNIWILDSRSGLFRFNRQDDSFTRIDAIDEGPDSQYYDLLADRKGRLWIAHNRGIAIYDPVSKSTRTINTPKLQFDVQSYQANSGLIFYVNENQLYIFNENVPINSHVPPVYLTRLLINGANYNKIIRNSGDVSSLASLDLPFHLNTLTFEFAALNYLNPERNKYRYLMEGFDKDTVESGPGLPAEYKQLPPGRYRFWVTGSNNDGIWNPAGTSLDIRIHPPWYRSTLAFIIYILSLISLVAGYIRLRTYRLTREKIKLTARIEAATAELEQKNLQLAEIDRIKTHFFTDISHEIRTPLSLILGPLENISKEEMLSTRMAGMIELMKRNANRLMDLVNQLLDISRLDAGRMKIILMEDDIVKCLRILVYEFLSMAETRHIKYMAELPEKAFKTFFDRDKIEKIISNLLSNAFKYTPLNGTVWCVIRIETDKINDSQSLLHIKVQDSGPGISKENQARIFDRFYRVEGHNEAESHGTGIGLSLVQDFVSLLHGELSLSSAPGTGSEFSVTIPLGKDHLSLEEYMITQAYDLIADNKVASHQAMKYYTADIKERERSKTRILIIEDNMDLRNFIKESLNDEYHILEAENGRAGINTAFTMMPDLIVTDIMMPDTDGIELCTKLKNDERTSHIPIIMLTAKATTDDRIEGFRSGADDYIVKPFSMTELKARISNLLALREKLKVRYSKFHAFDLDKELPGSVDDRFMAKVLKIISEDIRDYTFDVGSLHEKIGMSRTHLTRKLKILTGISPGILIRNVRLEKAAELLEHKTGNITEIANSVGISNPSGFTRLFRSYFGVSPKEYSKRQR